MLLNVERLLRGSDGEDDLFVIDVSVFAPRAVVSHVVGCAGTGEPGAGLGSAVGGNEPDSCCPGMAFDWNRLLNACLDMKDSQKSCKLILITSFYL